MLPVARIRAAITKPFLPVAFFLAGVTFDSITLTRIDRLRDNLILLLYLSLLSGLIVLTTRADLGRTTTDATVDSGNVKSLVNIESLIARAQPHYPHAVQFLLGGLFSAYTVFYSQSASLTTTAVFFALLVVLLVMNEFLRDRLTNVRLLVSLYALVVFSFFTFFLPVLTGFMNTWVFLIGAGLSAAVTIKVVRLIYQQQQPVPSRWEEVWTSMPAIGLIVVLVGFYFLKWIPPVPLALKFAGVYHQIASADGEYLLSFEKASWYQFWKRSDDPFHGAGPSYCFTAVFAPVALHTTIFHRWQYRAHPGRDFSTTDRIAIAIAGGREKGYRGYTVKRRVMPGEWRVDVETADGRVVGRVSFRVEEQGDETPELETITH
ncbi:MAG TPA: DUF2914 domain-containing protein [Nitrospirales bacterium]|nr:DUF2914 domain-containing protein [Nitrospirales bacterium]